MRGWCDVTVLCEGEVEVGVLFVLCVKMVACGRGAVREQGGLM